MPLIDETGFLKAICEKPDDIAIRLIFADYLEERILSWEDDGTFADWVKLIRREVPDWSERDSFIGTHGLKKTAERLIRSTLADVLPKTYKIRLFNPPFDAEAANEDQTLIHCCLRHGFIESIACTQRLFIGMLSPRRDFAKQLFLRHPVRGVHLTRQRPFTSYSPGGARHCNWNRGGLGVGTYPRELIAHELFCYLGMTIGRYPELAAAFGDLQQACLKYGRRKAGLELEQEEKSTGLIVLPNEDDLLPVTSHHRSV